MRRNKFKWNLAGIESLAAMLAYQVAPRRLGVMYKTPPDPFAGASGGGETSTETEEPLDVEVAEAPDVPPVNGGPDRTDLTGAEIEVPGATGDPSQARLPADPNQRAGARQPVAPTGVRDYLAGIGMNLPSNIADDAGALGFLATQIGARQQEDYFSKLGRQIAPQAQQYQQFLQQQQTPAAPVVKPWQAPEFDQRWAQLVTRDEATGVFLPRPGVDPSIAQKVNAYADWKAKYDANPAEVLNGMVDERARQLATETFDQRFAQHTQQQAIQQIANENAAWLYQPGPDGSPARDWQGKPQFSTVGVQYIQALQEVRSAGVTDPIRQNNLAKQIVRANHAQQWYAEQEAAGNPTVQTQRRQAAASPPRNPLQAQPPSRRAKNPATVETNDDKGLSLFERARRDLAAEGVTDDDIANSAG